MSNARVGAEFAVALSKNISDSVKTFGGIVDVLWAQFTDTMAKQAGDEVGLHSSQVRLLDELYACIEPLGKARISACFEELEKLVSGVVTDAVLAGIVQELSGQHEEDDDLD